MAKLNNQAQDVADDAERLRLAVALANNRQRSSKVEVALELAGANATMIYKTIASYTV